MNPIVLIISTLIILESVDQNDALGVNEGASTSAGFSEPEEVSDEEKCEIDNYVEGFMSVVVAEEISQEDTREIILHNSEEFIFYRNYFQNIFKFLQYGLNYREDRENLELLGNHEKRTIYFRRRVNEKFMEMMVGTCSKQFSQKIELVYDKVNKSLSIVQEMSVSPDDCLKESTSEVSKRKKRPLNSSHEKSAVYPSKVPRFEESDHDSDNSSLKWHNIIPLSLIARFYEIWFKSSLNSGFGATTCPITRRLMHWVDILRGLEPSSDSSRRGSFAFDFMSSNPYLNRVMESLLSWSPDGNRFFGPTPRERGPLYPMFDRRDRYEDYAFEFDCEPIIGRNHYLAMLALYKRLHEYVYIYSTQMHVTDVELALTGSEIIISMLLQFLGRGVTPYDIDQWEYRQLTRNELSRIREEDRDRYKDRYFWAIKKSAERLKRSLAQENVNPKTCYSMKNFSNHRWGEFISHLLTAFLQRLDAKWSCDFQNLFFSYQFSTTSDDCHNKNFDKFLLSKISYSDEWLECVNFNLEVPNEWCLVWRRFMLYEWSEMEAEEYHHDIKILLHWLKEKVLADNAIVSRESTSENLVCLKDVPSPIRPGHCESSLHGKEKWFTPPTGKFLIILQDQGYDKTFCRCSGINTESLRLQPEQDLNMIYYSLEDFIDDSENQWEYYGYKSRNKKQLKTKE